jgi:hypothetical protein
LWIFFFEQLSTFSRTHEKNRIGKQDTFAALLKQTKKSFILEIQSLKINLASIFPCLGASDTIQKQREGQNKDPRHYVQSSKMSCEYLQETSVCSL